MNLKEKLIEITRPYFDEQTDYFTLTNATKAYYSLLEELSEKNLNTVQGRSNLGFDNGVALGTNWAAMCINDMLRTKQFIRGIDKAIVEKKKKKKKINFLYAGTGPYAALLLPIILRQNDCEINYTFLEINPLSLELLNKTLEKLELNNKNITALKEDASTYIIKSTNHPDIIVSETMQNALAKEQQVSIFINLMSQVSKKTIFIPEKINLYIGLKKPNKQNEINSTNFKIIDEVFSVSKSSKYFQKLLNQKLKTLSFPVKKTFIKKEEIDNNNMMVLLTDIVVFNDVKISFNESGLTTPLYIQPLEPEKIREIEIETEYKIYKNPRLDYKIKINHI